MSQSLEDMLWLLCIGSLFHPHEFNMCRQQGLLSLHYGDAQVCRTSQEQFFVKLAPLGSCKSTGRKLKEQHEYISQSFSPWAAPGFGCETSPLSLCGSIGRKQVHRDNNKSPPCRPPILVAPSTSCQCTMTFQTTTNLLQGRRKSTMKSHDTM